MDSRGPPRITGDVSDHHSLRGSSYWRERAHDARSLANLIDEPEARAAMLEIAMNFDKLAEQLVRWAVDAKAPS
jgi:hypothetical protein